MNAFVGELIDFLFSFFFNMFFFEHGRVFPEVDGTITMPVSANSSWFPFFG